MQYLVKELKETVNDKIVLHTPVLMHGAAAAREGAADAALEKGCVSFWVFLWVLLDAFGIVHATFGQRIEGNNQRQNSNTAAA